MAAYRQRQLDALGDSSRRAIIERLRRGSLPVGELANVVSLSRPAVSQHLRILGRAHLVRHRSLGTRNFYELDPKGFATLRAYFESFWGGALDAFQTELNEGKDAKR